MGWTTLTKRAIGYLITKASDVDLWIDDIHYLKGQAGNVSYEASLLSDTDNTDDLGSAALRWANIYARNVFGSRMRLNPNIREVRYNWEDPAPASYQATFTATGGGSVANAGGSGQLVFKVDNDAAAARSADLRPTVELSSSLSNHWDRVKKPYMRVEFSLNAEDASAGVFIGFRQTPGLLVPGGTEHHAGLAWEGGANWVLTSGNGTTTTSTSLTTDPTVAARHVLELYVNAATNIELWLDGVKQLTKTTNLPAADMEWQILLETDGLGAATDSILTIGALILQEELA
mgnify:CR=1 FL=1